MTSVAPVVFGDVSRPLLVAGNPELRVCKAACILNNQEIGLFSDEVVVNFTL